MEELRDNARGATEWDRWLKMSMALALAEATGRRLGSIRMLRWDDIDLEAGEIRWRRENDKKGRETVVPIPPALLDRLEAFSFACLATQVERYEQPSEFLFAAYRDPAVPMDRHLFDQWLSVAEEKAGLKKLEGGLWHPYRRKWATERKDQPMADVMAAGGWSDADTLLRSYQQADKETLRRVVNHPNRLREAADGDDAAASTA